MSDFSSTKAHAPRASATGVSAPLRVLLATYAMDNRWTGVGKWSHCISNGLTSLGFVVTSWFAHDFPLVRWCGRFSILVYPIMLAYRLVHNRNQFDVALIHEPSAFWYSLLRRFLKFLPPVVVVCHNLESKVFRQMLTFERVGLAHVPLGSRIKAPLLRFWQSDGAIRLADHVVCLSSFDLNYLTTKLKCRPERLTFQFNGVSSDDFHDRKDMSFRRRVLFIGGWIDVKGKRILPPLWSKVREKFPDASLTLIGTGYSSDIVLPDFEARNRASITVIPRVENPFDMIDCFKQHDVFIMPSLTEATPLALLEAMAATLPAVASRAGGIPDIITDGVDGLLFEPVDIDAGADRVCHLLANPAEALAIGQAGQRRARELSWGKSCETLSQVIKRVITRGQG